MPSNAGDLTVALRKAGSHSSVVSDTAAESVAHESFDGGGFVEHYFRFISAAIVRRSSEREFIRLLVKAIPRSKATKCSHAVVCSASNGVGTSIFLIWIRVSRVIAEPLTWLKTLARPKRLRRYSNRYCDNSMRGLGRMKATLERRLKGSSTLFIATLPAFAPSFVRSTSPNLTSALL